MNEAALVSAVLEHKLASNASRAIEAAIQLWTTMEERPADTDAAHTEVWSALTEMGITRRAADAALAAMVAGAKVRFQAFIDLGESVSDPDANRQLAQAALDQHWEPEYLFASLMRLVEANHEAVALAFIRDNTTALSARSDS